jgi:multimeric flavodoxin WrbA
MRVLGIGGSPRRGSNSDLLLREAMAGAAAAGAETRVLNVTDLNIMPCNHCDACLRSGACPFQDDMQKVYRELEQADRLILASPIHFMGLPSQLKGLIDRAQALWARKYLLKLPPLGDNRQRQGLFLAVGGRSGDKPFEPALATVKAFFACLDINFEGMLAYPSLNNRAEILNNTEGLRQAREAGVRLAAGAQVLPEC